MNINELKEELKEMLYEIENTNIKEIGSNIPYNEFNISITITRK